MARARSRGQTTLDFATGVSVFIFILLFVIMFIPGTLQPFTSGPQEETAASDRIANLLVMDVLATGEEPYVLDGECTGRLLGDQGDGSCDFDGRTLWGRLDVPDRQFLNVTVREQATGTRLCWDDSGETVVDAGDSACDWEYAAGTPSPETSRSVVAADRTVKIDGRMATVTVRMW